MLDSANQFLIKVKSLSLFGWLAVYLSTLFAPLAPFVVPVIALTTLDIITGIKASQKEANKKQVVNSKKLSDKIKLLAPFLMGLLAIRLCEHSFPNFFEFDFPGVTLDAILTKLYVGLYIITETISVLENVSRMGYRKADPLIKFLRIKQDEIEDKLEGKDETKK